MAKRKLIFEYPMEAMPYLVKGLAHRRGFKPSDADPNISKPIGATTAAHRAHASYVRTEEDILDGQGQPTGRKQITETWEPSMQEAAHDAAVELLWTHASRGCLDMEQETMKGIKADIDGVADSVSISVDETP